MVVFPDTMYTFRDTQRGGGGKIDNFFSYLTFVTASSWSKYCMRLSGGGEGAGGPEPPGKTQVLWDYIGNKQLYSPRKSWIPSWKKRWSPSGTSGNYNFLWNKPLAFCKIREGLLKRIKKKNRCQRIIYDRWTWTPPFPPWQKFLDPRMPWYKSWAIVASSMLECHIHVIIAGDFSWKG